MAAASGKAATKRARTGASSGRSRGGPETLRLMLLPCTTAIIAAACQAARGQWGWGNSLLLSMADIVSRGLPEHELCLSDVVLACAVDGVTPPEAFAQYLSLIHISEPTRRS
eukprot:3462513-Prymnesium_polylepis.1